MECIIRTPHYQAVRRPQTKTLFIVLPTDEAMSDADPDRAPARRVPVRDERGLVNYYEEVEQDIDRLWRERLGKYLYDFVVKNDMARQGIQRTCFSFAPV